MIEFLLNIGRWFMDNKAEIVLFLTSSQFIALVTTIVTVWRSNKSTKENTKSTTTLNQTIESNKKLNDTCNTNLDTSNQNLELTKKMDDYLKKMDERLENSLSLQTEKLNAIIEVQTIVYSTIKDEKVRNTVNNLLMNAKYAETAIRADLQRQIEELRAQVQKKSQELNEFVENAANSVVATVTGESENKPAEVIERY